MAATRDLGRALHALTARLDREADRILREEQDTSYSRFLLLWAVSELDGPTQRALAERLGLREASVSRMTALLAAEGLLVVESDAAGGNRRRLELSVAGEHLVARCGTLLEAEVDALVAEAGLTYGPLRRDVGRLLAALERSA